MFRTKERSKDVNGSGLEFGEGGKQLETVQVFPESDAVLSAKLAGPDGVRGIRCCVRPVEVPSQTVLHLVLPVVTGQDEVVHQR